MLVFQFWYLEIEKMRKQMEDEVKRTLENNEKEILEMKKSYEEKLAEAQRKVRKEICLVVCGSLRFLKLLFSSLKRQ